jgi:hypothetical protein
MASLSKRGRQPAISLLSSVLLACTYWQAGTPNPAEFISEKQPEKVRVTRADGSRLQLRYPRVVEDSLLGTAGGEAQGDTLRRVAIPLGDLQNVEVKKTNVGNTVGLVVVSAAVVTFSAVMIDCNNKEGFEKLDCP